MSAVADDVAPGPILPAWLRRYPLSPAEGWLTVAFVILMSLTVAWSLDDAAWVLGIRQWGDFYAWATLIAALIGFAGAKARWPRWTVHLVGAVVAALVVPVMVGSILVGEAGGSPADMYRATAESAVQAWIDLAVLKLSVTQQVGHYLLVIGLICWSVGQYAAYAVFGHRRPLDAVIVVGIVLLSNMSMTFSEQLGYLVIFTVAALCVLARTHAFDEEATWIRRRIGDASAVRSLYLRGGAVFIAAAVFGSLALTASASSAPLAGLWGGFESRLIEWSRDFQRLFPFGSSTRIGGFGFGNSATITGKWVSSESLQLTIQLPPGEKEPHYWRAVAYDRYDMTAWTWTQPQDIERRPGQQILTGLAEDPTDVFGRRDLTYRVRVEDPSVGDFVFGPQDLASIDAESAVRIIGGQGWFGAVRSDAREYTVTASVPVRGVADNGLTGNRLAAVGRNYSPEVTSIYTKLPPNAMGPNAQALLDEFLAEVGDNPYELAAAIEDRFRNSGDFDYEDDVVGLCSPDISVAECFARHRQGYCLHYATTMAVLLRAEGIPARVALGYLPGERDVATGIETIKASQAHSWVEVYFPTFGWVAFDPTGGGRAESEQLPAGPAVTPAPSVAPSFGSFRPIPRETDPVNQGAPTGNTTTGRGSASPGLLVVVAVLLLVAVGGLVFVAWQRGPRGEVTPEAVWRGVQRLAGRFGFGPRPQQTVYEYAGTLGELLPGSRPELHTVARAKVELSYGRRQPGGDALKALRDAHRRLRVDLLRLAFRRKDRRRLRGR